jgi:hypothetical protein
VQLEAETKAYLQTRPSKSVQDAMEKQMRGGKRDSVVLDWG